MNTEKNLHLRLRFYKTTTKSVKDILTTCDILKEKLAPDFLIKSQDHHIWIHVGVMRREKFSPHLHLRIEKMEDGNTAVYGLAGPEPVLWWLFVFFHIIIGITFILFSMIAYSKWKLEQNFGFDLVIMLLIIGLWISLYYIARTFRKKGTTQMIELEKVMNSILN